MPLALVLGLLQSALILLWGIFVAYLLVLSVLALTRPSRRPPTAPQAAPLLRFAIIIPAHNEEGIFEEALASTRRLDYPRSLYEVIVVADNCTDRTAEIARGLGATVYERHDPSQVGKGWALGWIFERLLQSRSGFDAFVVADADSVLSSNFLHVMALQIGEGRSVIQARNMVINGLEGWRPAIMSISFSLMCYLRPLARSRLGLSVGLKGNGMCFVTETLRTIPWRASSLAEDVEYSLELCLRGVRVAFAPQASVASRMPLSGQEAESQAIRWEFGRMGMIRRYLGPLLARAIRDADLGCLDTALELSIPPMSLLFGFPLLFLFADSLIWFAFGSSSAGLLGIFWALTIAGEAIYVGAGIGLSQTSGHLWKALVHVPKYVLWKVWILIAGWLSKERAWTRTPRRRIQ
jgi:cellulose synthase/poly-beta-1,6-N-acetylglucosamine synthase-like glycosyltransferase